MGAGEWVRFRDVEGARVVLRSLTFVRDDNYKLSSQQSPLFCHPDRALYSVIPTERSDEGSHPLPTAPKQKQPHQHTE